MRPTGVVLIAIYHFLSAAFLLLCAIALMVGGSVLGAMFGSAMHGPWGGAGLGMAIGMIGGIFCLLFAVVALLAGFGIWKMQEWGRILCLVLAVISALFSLPGLMFMHHIFFGGFGILRLAINVLIIWYLLQPQVVALFRPAVVAAPRP